MKKSADTSLQLHPLLQERWSPRAFDGSHRIVDEDLNAILRLAVGRLRQIIFNRGASSSENEAAKILTQSRKL